MSLSAEQIQRALLVLVAFVLSVSVHEFGTPWSPIASATGCRGCKGG